MKPREQNLARELHKVCEAKRMKESGERVTPSVSSQENDRMWREWEAMRVTRVF